MIPTFVIGLREGLEAALIVGIVGAFLINRGDRSGLKPMWAGVGLAVALSIGAAVGLEMAGRRLPLVAREVIEGTLTLVAVAGVSYMLVWMRRHSSAIKGELEAKTAVALSRDSTLALVGLAFVAVIREGLETAVFLLALLKGSSNVVLGLGGAVLGIAIASVLGFAIYRGGVRFDLGRFFRVTGAVLVLVAAGLVAASIHEFAEAGLVPWGNSPAMDLSGVIAPGTLRAGLLTAFLGLQPVPTYAELVGWLIFLIPAGAYVLWPPRRRALRLST